MSNFVINDIIRSCNYNNEDVISTPMISKGNGTITNLSDSIVTIKWVVHNSIELYENIETYATSNLYKFVLLGYPIQKKVGDNDWIDKDGNHYNDAGDKQ